MLSLNNPEKRLAYAQLMRLDKPVGNYLLLWPTLWALFSASQGFPSWHLMVVFVLGVWVMRAAGCVINDFADRNLDGAVERTKTRPLATKVVSAKEALILFFVLILLAFCLVLTLNWHTILLSVVALLLASLYPFMKRFTYLPQFVLGAAFSWSIPMAYMAASEQLPAALWVLYVANLIWTVAYDTLYAMVDRDDDLKVGIKSTAILFGQFDKLIVGVLQACFIGLMVLFGVMTDLTWPFYSALIIASGMLIRQQLWVRNRDKQACFKAFLDNHPVGMVIFIGLAANFWLSAI
ncbi:4-hydroxybenzoate octaprenyltransferase [Saccharobesus litoralis]|uniref:4-hydroxybenzoate octaprenyltransferase n=1 Tax=Saccharobesus litoralis TaxID=2172099 RepID=A0A2S0VWR6_9ALTE|nr:4-hydroxybenzoate octaprenyltransferase [Saccharobesus litoralis]AWB68658.1 4-hydroxybenzoate octaprenyltransferase [Saccharobesus litoralis]